MTEPAYRRILQIPLSPMTWATVDLPLPLDSDEWIVLERFLALVRATTTWEAPAESPMIVDCVARRFDLSVRELLFGGRTDALAEARWVAMMLLRQSGLSLPQIGVVLHKDHTTVLHGLRQIALRPDLVSCAAQLASRLDLGRLQAQDGVLHNHTAPTTSTSL